jgi:quercetin dioxygenase-like cupin family protein
MNQEIEILKEKTKGLKNMIKGFNKGMIEYDTEDGICLGTSIFNWGEEIAAQMVFLTKGGSVVTHSHEVPVWEYLLVFRGVLEVKIKDLGIKKILKPNEDEPSLIYLRSEENHEVKALEHTLYLAITIPRGEGYPK